MQMSSLPAAQATAWRAGLPLRRQLNVVLNASSLRVGATSVGPSRKASLLHVKQAARRVHVLSVSTSTAVAADNAGLILGLGAPGSWDNVALGGPSIKCFLGDSEERWFMWYHGRDGSGPHPASVGSGNIGLATSSDGIEWRRGSQGIEMMVDGRAAAEDTDVGAALSPNPDWWTFDTCHVGNPHVQVISNSSVDSGVGIYWMFYSGGDFSLSGSGSGEGEQKAKGLLVRPGLALSQDGRNWARVEGEHHTGALFDVGPKGSFDAAGASEPNVTLNGPRGFQMFYTGLAADGTASVGAAKSADGFNWQRLGQVLKPGPPGSFDAAGVSAPHVQRVGQKEWVMFYEALDAKGVRTIGAATSADSVTWEKHYGGKAPVLGPGGDGGAWDAAGVGAPFAVSMAKGLWRLYYQGYPAVGGAAAGVGLALSEGATTFAFKRKGAAGGGGAAGDGESAALS